MGYGIHYACASHVGNVRNANQDNFICDKRFMELDSNNTSLLLCGTKSSKDPSLFGVFDGMGGEECGEIASYIAAKCASALEIGEDAASSLSEFCKKANCEICDYAKDNEVTAMGTTAAILAFTKGEITLCNIGDSKIFRFYDGALEQISQDHVAISAFGVKPLLLQNLGIPKDELEIAPYLAKGVYQNNDIFLISSDGLTDMVAVKEIEQVLAVKPINEAVVELLDRALANGGRDNITLILCRIEGKFGWPFYQKRHGKKKGDKNDNR